MLKRNNKFENKVLFNFKYYIYVVVQFSPRFRVEFEFPLYFGFVIYMYNNEFEEGEIKI